MPELTPMIARGRGRQPRRGVALLLVLVTMGTATTLTLGYLASQDNAAPVSRNVTRAAQARAVASSGLDLAVAIMQTDSSWRTSHANGVLLSDLQLGSGRVDISLIDAATNLPPAEGAGTIRVSVTARVDDLTQSIEAIASVIHVDEPESEDVSGFAVWVHSGIQFQGDSSMRRWDNAPMTSLGRRLFMGTDATSPHSIDIGSQTTLHDVTIIHEDEASLGLVRNDSDLLLRTRTAMSGFGPPTSPGSLPPLTGQEAHDNSFNPTRGNWSDHPTFLSFGSGSQVDIPTDSNLAFSSLELDGGCTLRISGETTLVVHEDILLEDARIILEEGATLNLVCGGDLIFRNAYIGESDGDLLDGNGVPRWFDSSRVRITSAASCSDDQPWRIEGDSIIKAVIEAPEARLIIQDRAILAGRIAVDHLRARKNAQILYDHGLDSGQGATRLTSLNPRIRDRISQRMDQRLRRIADRFDLSGEDGEGNTLSGYTSRFGLAADDSWWESPSNRDIPVDVQLLMHGGNTNHWETLVADSTKRSMP